MGVVREMRITSLMDVPGQLRKLADKLEAEKAHVSVVVVIGLPDGNVDLRSCGPRSSPLEAIGWIATALGGLTAGSITDETSEPGPAA